VKRLNPRLAVAVAASLLDEILLVVAVLWILPLFGIHLPLWVVLILAVIFPATGALTFVIVRKKPNLGFENQIGVKGLALSRIGKKGTVRIGRENWAARTEGPVVEPGTPVVVIGQNALILSVVPDHAA